jgi:hypothetical protein
LRFIQVYSFFFASQKLLLVELTQLKFEQNSKHEKKTGYISWRRERKALFYVHERSGFSAQRYSLIITLFSFDIKLYSKIITTQERRFRLKKKKYQKLKGKKKEKKITKTTQIHFHCYYMKLIKYYFLLSHLLRNSASKIHCTVG